jgi:hypothetical protein
MGEDEGQACPQQSGRGFWYIFVDKEVFLKEASDGNQELSSGG